MANNYSENTNIQRSRAARVGLGEPGSSSAIGCFEGEANKTKADEADRLFWLFLSKHWANWRGSLHIVQPATVIRWHRQGFRYYWRWKSRRRGRPRIEGELRILIREMSKANVESFGVGK